jgi:hypothetical protein
MNPIYLYLTFSGSAGALIKRESII